MSETTKTKILVVEDNDNWRNTFCNWLRFQGYDVLEAACGIEFEQQAPQADVIIMDINMPMERNGPEKRTVGMDVLLKLQKEYMDHPAIQNPIVRSMWSRNLFTGDRYRGVKVKEEMWKSREAPIAELSALIKKIESSEGEIQDTD
jgi:CheY-like chemotaxis protein